VKRLIDAVDGYQQRHAWLAVPFAVAKRYADNRAWNLAALIAYYGFVAIFPLLLVLITVLDVLIRSDPALRDRLLRSALAHYPVVGPELQGNLNPLHETGPALVFGLLVMFVGARGVAMAIQNALNSLWEIPWKRRPRFPWSWLRAFGLLIVIGAGLTVTSALSGLASGAGNVLTNVGAALLALAVSLVLNVGMYWLGFRLATAPEIGWFQMLPGAALSAFSWQVMQSIGGYLVTHQLARSSNLYGTFAIVLGLIGWLYIEAQLTVCAVEVNVVLNRRLWPWSLTGIYADAENRGENHQSERPSHHRLRRGFRRHGSRSEAEKEPSEAERDPSAGDAA